MQEHFTPGQPQLLTFQQFAQKNPWPKEATLRSLYYKRMSNGLDKAFKKWGRRILVDEAEFFRVLKASDAGKKK